VRVTSIIAAFALAACQTADPSAPRPTTQTPPNRFAQALIVSLPPGIENAPVVLLLEGNDGSTRMHPTWGPFLIARGIAVVQIQSARARGRANWQGTGCQLQYAEDPRAVIEYLRGRPGIDTARFAVMGFSRGGTEALGAAPHFAGAENQPAAVFAFYPGCSGACGSEWSRMASQVPVHVFYGAADSWGAHMNTIGACRALARSGVTYHEYPGAPHGFDAPWQGAFFAGGGRHVYAPNAEATAAAKATVAETLARAWGTPR
jgi:dienelactone hydrolase